MVGSGAGGAVIAAECAEAGKDVLVLEMGAYRNESDFKQLEMPGYFELYYGGGLAASESGSIAILAGSTLGGGTVVNYMNCVRTPDAILREWDGARARRAGRSRRSCATTWTSVMERIGANTEATKQNGTHQRLMAGCDALGYEHRPIWRNASLHDDPEFCGYCPMGCQQGCKRSAMKTWLQDASDAGARCVVGCHADRILVEDGRAAGVEATVTHADGSTTALTVAAPTWWWPAARSSRRRCCCAAASAARPSGKNLRLHPAFVVMGVYDEPIEGWNGQIQSPLSDHFFDIEDGYGFLIEATRDVPGASRRRPIPWESGEQHKQLMQTLPLAWRPSSRWPATTARARSCSTTSGRPVVRWDFDDEVDARLAVRAHVELARLHQAAGRGRGLHARTTASSAGARARTSTRSCRAARGGALRAARRDVLHGAPDGLVPDGLGPGDLGRRRPRRAARREGRLDRRRERVPDGARA